MSVAGIKSLVIAALVLVNAFFLSIIIIDTYTDARDERQAIESVCAILRSNGIEISPDDVKTADALRTMRTSRGVELEAVIAYAFLGPVEMTDQNAIYLYENTDRGTAEFRTAGDFRILLNEGVITNATGTLRTVQALLKDMKLETSAITIYTESEGETALVVNAFRGASIFNCTIEFAFSGDSLRTVSGRYAAGIEPAEDGVELSLVGTALLGFLAEVKSGDIECTEIMSVEAGYQHSVAGPFGEGVITPAWLITTDGGRYIVDSATGDIRQI